MTRILLIRHAANDALKEKRLAGRTPGVHLNEEGQAQAQALAARLAAVDLAAVYASPMERAQETAQPVAQIHDLALQIHPGLNEVDYGRWKGEELEKLRRRKLWRTLQISPSMARFPGGERMWAAQTRVVGAVEEIRAAHPQENVALVFHADPIKMVIAHYLGLPLDLFQRLVVMPASLTILELGESIPRLVQLNDVAHLAQEKGG